MSAISSSECPWARIQSSKGRSPAKHAVKQGPDVLFRHAMCLGPFRRWGGEDTPDRQMQERVPVLSHQPLEAVMDGRLSGRRQAAHFHLLSETLANADDSSSGKPAPQVIHRTADGSEAVSFQNIERVAEQVAEDRLPAIAFEMFDQGHPSLGVIVISLRRWFCHGYGRRNRRLRVDAVSRTHRGCRTG